MVQTNVQVDYVAVQQYALIGDAVADNLIDRRAERLGEKVVV